MVNHPRVLALRGTEETVIIHLGDESLPQDQRPAVVIEIDENEAHILVDTVHAV